MLRTLGHSGIQVSPLCLGTMLFGGATPAADAERIVHAACDRGLNFFDTANVYTAGESERVLGRAIADRRERVVLASKAGVALGAGPNLGGGTRLHLRQQLDASLRRLGTDYLDLYYLHVPDPRTPLEETVRALDDFVRQGKVLYTGCSNFRAGRLMELLATADRLGMARLHCTQPLYNLCNRDAEVDLLPLCQSQRLGVVTYSPLARGVLSGKYRAGEPFPEGSRAARNDPRLKQTELRDESFEVARQLSAYCASTGRTVSQFALAWCLANPLITSVIIGPRTLEQFADNVGCLEIAWSAADEAVVDRLVPPGEHTGKGYLDPAFPVLGRPTGAV